MLNLMAKLRVSPTTTAPLIDHIESVIFADVDRIYCKVDGALYERLRKLSDGTRRNVFFARASHTPAHTRSSLILCTTVADTAFTASAEKDDRACK